MQHGEYISYHQNGEILLKGYFEDGDSMVFGQSFMRMVHYTGT